MLLLPICAPLQFYALRPIWLVQQHVLVLAKLFIFRLLQQLLVLTHVGYVLPLLQLLILRYECVLSLLLSPYQNDLIYSKMKSV